MLYIVRGSVYFVILEMGVIGEGGVGGVVWFWFLVKVRPKCAIAMVSLVNIGFIESIKNLKKSKIEACATSFMSL